MWTFAVWAPRPNSLDVRVNGRDVPMKKTAGGWWRADVADAAASTQYLFVVNGTTAVPDPRSAFQPYGVHGPSRTVDHNAFSWTDYYWQPSPLSSAIIYELHIGTFTPEGTFESAICRLPYLSSLGVTHVELMPINEFSGDWGWGYDGVDLYAPHHRYGGPEGLKRLVDACHANHMAILLDVVYNHVGPSGNYLSLFGPYFTDHYSTPWGEAVNLDRAGSKEVRRFLVDNALMWLRDYHFDGLRLDAVHALFDASAIHLLEELREEVCRLEASLGRPKVLIAESDLNDPRLVRSPEAGGFGLDAQWSDDFHHALHAVLTGETLGYYEDFGSIEQIGKAVQHTFVYDGSYSKHRQRNHGRPASALSSHRFLGYLQTHDQVGNRARGERISHLAGLRRAKIGAALVLTSPFIPMLFQGEEWAASAPFQYFTNHPEPELGRAVSEGRRKEFAAFGWKADDIPDPQSPATFTRSKLGWDELEQQPHREILDWYRHLISLRRTIRDLSSDRNDDLTVEYEKELIKITRGACQIVCNFARDIREVSVRDRSEVLLASDPHARLTKGSAVMAPESVMVLRTTPETK